MSIFSDLKVPSNKQLKLITWIVFFLSVGFTIWVYARFWDYKTDGGPAGPQDIYFLWEEGGRLLAGENPYDRRASGNMLENDKYATHFPLFYMLASATRLAGFQEYPAWVGLWRYIFLFFNYMK